MRGFILALLSVFLVLPAAAGYRTGEDNLGRKRVSTIEAVRAISDVSGGPVLHVPDFDLCLSLGATGSDNNSGVEERVLLGLSVYGYVAETAAIGLDLSRPNLAEPNVVAFAPVAKLYLFRDPFSSWNKGVRLRPVSYSVATGDNPVLSGGAWSVDPTLSGFVEFPFGPGALSFDVGATYVLTSLSEDVPDNLGAVSGAVTFIWWIR